jgi:hypothetical protein
MVGGSGPSLRIEGDFQALGTRESSAVLIRRFDALLPSLELHDDLRFR